MGSLFHILDINEDIMARKVAHKRHVGGLDAPRNSLELQMETSYGLYSARDNILYAHHMANESSNMDYYLTEAPIKKLISEEISKKPNTRQNAPSVVARLMGVDMLPFGSKPAPRLCDIKNKNPTGKSMNKKPSKNDQLEVDSFGHYLDTYPDHCTNHVKSNKPKPREHPQEEELQKFKKEFEAWQAARFQECANFVKVGNNGPAQLIAQEDLNREKMYLYTNSNRTTNMEARTKSNDHELDNVPGPTKIVILRPGPDRTDISEDSWNTTTPSTSEDRNGIEDFLEEVKERLKSELQGKCPKTRTSSIRGSGIETPYREKPSEMKLLRSESTRSYRSDFQLDSPELFISRGTRRLLAERLRNVLKGETNPMVVRNSSRLSVSDYDEQSEDNKWIGNNFEKQSMSFRREHDDEGGVHLIRSLSAPVSGTSFGKLLLKDRHILTGAHIRRKHEVVEKVSLNIKKQKKDKFNIREKVSSFRYSLTLRGRLFRRRVKSVEGFDQNRNIFLRDIRSGPTIMASFCEAHENSTEVPPSPASVCSSSVHEEYWRQAEYLSPISSTGGHQLEDSEMPHVFREINSNLNELRRKLDQLDGAVPEETIKEEHLTEAEVDIEDQTEVYIRDLLVAAGLYDSSFSQSLSKWDPLGKPISTQVFEEVEGTYNNESTNAGDERCRKDQGEKVNHRMILDLLNELLPALLREPVNISSSLGKATNGPVPKPLCGRKLLSRVWNIIRVHVYPPTDRSYYALDNVLAQDLKPATWSRLMDDDVNALGRDIECQIIGDMIYDVVKDMC
ncbi:hypothetical protein PHJA_002819900 [Phtheirospermum japonicum]|uniref:DUF4378 domain-containing protein n=1 Tax=Phtheirospermum japonicum TaxID=374723 RepID=A0A830DAG5_9LAMI|nr:hypothetical protein PHJA_002819900 [Phtheirospermum japonicum]